MSESWFKSIRSDDYDELLEFHPNAFLLLSLIARRAKRTKNGISRQNLEVGEALIGDYHKCGLTRQNYRNALLKLTLYGFVTIKTTNKGTIAKLCKSTVYDINIEDSNQQINQRPTNSQPTDSKKPTTKKNDIQEVKNDKNKDIAQTATRPRQDFRFCFNSKSFINLDTTDFEAWKLTYPSANVSQEMLKMVQWCLSNPTKAKSKSQWRKFVTCWLQKANDETIRKESYQSQNKVNGHENSRKPGGEANMPTVDRFKFPNIIDCSND